MTWNQLQSRLEDLLDWITLRWTQILIPLLIAVIAGFIVQSPFQQDLPEYRAGEIARADLRSPADILFLDEDLTRRRQESAVQAVLRVYDVDSRMQQSISSRLVQFFESGRQLTGPQESDKIELEEALGVELSDESWLGLRSSGFHRRIQTAVEALLQSAFAYYIVEAPIDEGPQRNRLVLRDLFSEQEQILNVQDLRLRARTLAQAQELIQQEFAPRLRLAQRLEESEKNIAASLAAKLLDVNVSLNRVETNARREEARSKVEPIVEEIAKGQMIIREADKVEQRHVLMLERIQGAQAERADLRTFAGFVSLIFLLIFIFHWVGRRNFRKFRLSARDRLVLGSFFIVALALVAALAAMLDGFNPNLSLTMLLPLGFAGMTLRLFTSMEITFFFIVLFSVCLSWFTQNPYIGLTSFTVAMAGAAAMRHIGQRLDVLKAGLFCGLIQAVCICLGVIMGLVDSVGLSPPALDLGMTVSLCLLAGLISAGLVLFSQPIIEFLGYTTDLRLMELSSTNHPLLRELIIKAPGTYFHSFTVSQLSEKAAESIHANPLFARVASLYHDVGKLRKPQYFIENIKGENRHDKMVPSMSALIISNHVKDGIELAHQHKLPQAIIDCIPQHHGTALISYFFDKAKKESEDEAEIDERDYRYPGPKPQTKEAAIIMLADAVEAASKSLAQAGSDQLRQHVNAPIRRVFLDGQLDECDLSLKDLNGIGNAFVNVLQGVYHQRIDYPHLRKEPKKNEETTKTLSKKIAQGSSDS